MPKERTGLAFRVKAAMKYRLPGIYGRLLLLRRYPAQFGDLVSVGRLKLAVLQGNRPIIINLSLRAGFFANLSSYISLLKYCELNGLGSVVRLTGPTYQGAGMKDDWFEKYFDRLAGPRRADAGARPRRITFRSVKALELPSIGSMLSLSEAARLLQQNASVKRDIATEADEIFTSQELDGSRTLGIHYRGTDKSFESERVAYESVLTVVRRVLDVDGPFDAVLVASDETDFVDYVFEQDLGVRVISPPYTAKGNPTTAPHMMPALDKLIVGREALVTCLALSKCSKLVRTSSYLSAWAKVFNPSLVTHTLNAPYNPNTFPEAQLLSLERP